MSDQISSVATSKQLAFLSAAGNFASIIALLIVLIDQASQKLDIPAEFMVWRLIFALVALVAAGGVSAITYLYCQNVRLKESTPLAKMVHITIAIMIACVVIGACIDGLLSALDWSRWLWTPRQLLWWMIRGPV